MTQEQKTVVVESEAALKIVRDLVSKKPELKLQESEAKTGFSYFAGKKRLCKVLKTKRGVRLEINVTLDKTTEDKILGLEKISAAMAHKKHLGTMKYMYRAGDHKEVKAIITAALKTFATEAKEAEVKEEPVQEAKQA